LPGRHNDSAPRVQNRTVLELLSVSAARHSHAVGDTLCLDDSYCHDQCREFTANAKLWDHPMNTAFAGFMFLRQNQLSLATWSRFPGLAQNPKRGRRSSFESLVIPHATIFQRPAPLIRGEGAMVQAFSRVAEWFCLQFRAKVGTCHGQDPIVLNTGRSCFFQTRPIKYHRKTDDGMIDSN
jgi:hypothetical protein